MSTMKPRKKAEPKPRVNRKDWRNLPPAEWNCATFLAYFAEENRERYGFEPYVPMRNWGFEQRALKTAIERYGAEVVRDVCVAAFDEYRPSREYPQLTAGFVLAYMAGRILPRVIADRDAQMRREEARKESESGPSLAEVAAWL